MYSIVIQSPNTEKSGIKGGCEMGKGEHNYTEEGQSLRKMEGDEPGICQL